MKSPLPPDGHVALTELEPSSPESRPGSQSESTVPPSSSHDIPSDTKPDVPDGGLRAWLQVAGAFVLFFNTW